MKLILIYLQILRRRREVDEHLKLLRTSMILFVLLLFKYRHVLSDSTDLWVNYFNHPDRVHIYQPFRNIPGDDPNLKILNDQLVLMILLKLRNVYIN